MSVRFAHFHHFFCAYAGASSAKLKLFGNSVAIGKSLEIGEGYAPNILSLVEEQPDGKQSVGHSNPHQLTVDELMENADAI